MALLVTADCLFFLPGVVDSLIDSHFKRKTGVKVGVNAWRIDSVKDASTLRIIDGVNDAYYAQFGLAVSKTRQQGGLNLDSDWTTLRDKISLEFEN